MSDKPIIVAGLVVFLALATLPFWYPRAAEPVGPPPELEPPAGALLFSAAWQPPEGYSEAEGPNLGELGLLFEKHAISLSGEATLAEGEQGQQWRKWRITDKDARYLVVLSEDTLGVYAGECVEEIGYMTGHHMDVLNRWRNAVVRDGDTKPVEINGKPYEKCLTGTCMGCHTNRETFCYRCHEYAGVLPFQPPCGSSTAQRPRGILCWDCHDESKGN